MKHTRNVLMAAFVTLIVIVAVITVACECGFVELWIADSDDRTEFVITAIVELLTLACIPTALRLFKFRTVASRLTHDGAAALLRFGLLRLALLGLPLIANVLLYYMYLSTSFFYMSILLAFSLVFVYPSMERCESETTSKAKRTREDSME